MYDGLLWPNSPPAKAFHNVIQEAEYHLSLLCTHAVVVVTQEMVTGYIDDGMVVLTCEVYGYLTLNDPIVRWSRKTGGARQPLQNTPPKYTVVFGSGSRLAQRPDGTTRQSIVATLTISQLETADAGRYFCETGGEERATQVTVVPGSGPTGGTLGTGETPGTGEAPGTGGTRVTRVTSTTGVTGDTTTPAGGSTG